MDTGVGGPEGAGKLGEGKARPEKEELNVGIIKVWQGFEEALDAPYPLNEDPPLEARVPHRSLKEIEALPQAGTRPHLLLPKPPGT